MPRTIMSFNNPTLKVADTEAGLSAGTAFECQITSAVVTPAANFTDVPATGCAPKTSSPGLTSFTLDLAWLQDWNAAGGGLSGYAWERAGDAVWFELIPEAGSPAVGISGEVYVTEGAVGGTFGDGSPGTSTASWPCLDKPTLATAVAAATSRQEVAA